MEEVEKEVFNPHLSKVLQSYRAKSMNSLSGPAGCKSSWDDSEGYPTPSTSFTQISSNHEGVANDEAIVVKTEPGLSVPAVSPSIAVPVPAVPLFFQQDQSRSERQETALEEESISCFVVGGEKRLCLPQILNNVLKKFSLSQINSECDEMQIFCSRCNHEQLETLKVCGIVPLSAPSCGLITKTDAERLCNRLLHDQPPKATEVHTKNSFKIYHECFGKCKGVFTPELYQNPTSNCIECCECHGMFSPQRFVVHSHNPQENRTCHWGFDSNNWRNYLLLAKDQEDLEQLKKTLDEVKDKFDVSLRKRKHLKKVIL